MTAAALALALAAPAAAQLSWNVSGDTAAVVGQEATLVYQAALPPGAKLAPNALASSTTDFAVVKVSARPDGSWAWTVLPLDEGKLSFTARWTRDGKAAAAPAAELEVRSADLPKDSDIEDIKPPLAARRALWPWALAAALLAGVYAAWRRWRRRARPGEPGAPPPLPLSPDAAAEKSLAELAASGLWERGEHAAYYLRLTDILRRYLEDRFGEPATAMTSAEVARLVKAKGPDLMAAATAREILQRADLVKFARLKPEAEDGPRDAQAVRGVVRATTPANLVVAPGTRA